MSKCECHNYLKTIFVVLYFERAHPELIEAATEVMRQISVDLDSNDEKVVKKAIKFMDSLGMENKFAPLVKEAKNLYKKGKR